MSQDERKIPVSDLGEASTAETVQDSISGTDAGAEGPIEGIGTVDNAKTTAAGAVGDFDEDAGKTKSTELEAKASAVVQEAVDISRAFLKSITKLSNVIQVTKLPNAAKNAEELRNIIQTSQLCRVFQEAEKLRKFAIELYEEIIVLFSNILELIETWSSIQVSRAEISSVVQEASAEILGTVQDSATAEFFSTVQETTVAFLITAFQRRNEASRNVHEAADVSSPFQDAAAEASHVVQETGTENAAAEREEEDGNLSHPPDTENSTLAISIPTVESHTQYKSSPDPSETELMK